MKKLSLYILAALFVLGSLLMSCAKSEDTGTEKGAIERMTDEAGEEMAERISGPLEKAKGAKELIDDNYRDMEENLENQ